MPTKQSAVAIGGAHGELAHCTGCGQGLNLGGAQSLGVTTAALEAFEKDHSQCKPGAFEGPRPFTPQQWSTGRDTGVSSLTIYAATCGAASTTGWYDVPHDPDDFGRCYRFLEQFPHLRPRLAATVEICPKWEPFVREWDALCELWREESPTGKAPKLYDAMKALEKEGEA